MSVSWQDLANWLWGLLVIVSGVFMGDLRGRVKALENGKVEQTAVISQISERLATIKNQIETLAKDADSEKSIRQRVNERIEQKLDKIANSIYTIESRSHNRRTDDDA